MSHAPPPSKQPRNPLHGVTLEAMVRALEAHFGWDDLAQRIPIRCFSHDPSVNSSLRFLRKTPWTRERVEGLYLFMRLDRRRLQGALGQAPREQIRFWRESVRKEGTEATPDIDPSASSEFSAEAKSNLSADDQRLTDIAPYLIVR